MVTDIIYFFKKDPTVKRDIVKAVSWRILGSIDTMLLGFLITGKLSVGIKIGALELLTKIALYFVHERIWHRIPFGLPYRMRKQKKTPAENGQLFRQTFEITRAEREKLNGHPSFTIWLTGLSGSGKSTLASKLDEWLHRQRLRAYVIDGDNTRLGINSDLDFSKEGREENIRRVAEICKLMNDAGVIVISSFISPFEESRRMAQQIIGEQHFTEVFVDASVATCTERDTKGLYQLALEGKIKNFTGVNGPYESPLHPALHINTDKETVEQSVASLIEWVKKHRLA